MKGFKLLNRRSVHAISAWLNRRVKWCVIDTHQGKVLIAHGSAMGYMTCPDTILCHLWDDIDHIICCHPKQVSDLYAMLFGPSCKFLFSSHTGKVAVRGEDVWVAAGPKQVAQ